MATGRQRNTHHFLFWHTVKAGEERGRKKGRENEDGARSNTTAVKLQTRIEFDINTQKYSKKNEEAVSREI